MQSKAMFTPITIGGCTIKNRLAMAPMATLGMITPDGCFKQRVVDYYVERAKGGVGLIITSAVKVENEIEKLKMPSFPCITLNPVHFLATASELTERVHAYGTKIFIQITFGLGRSAAPAFLDGPPVAPSAIPNYWDPSITCRELTTNEVEAMVRRFSEAAQVAKAAGFDGMEIHAVHEGYLLDQFTLSIFNRRTDKYGGDLKGRLTLPIEIVREIKKCAGAHFPVQLRYSIKSYIKDWRQGGLPDEDFKELGRDLDEGLEAAKILEEAGYDSFNADAGSYDAWYWAHPPMYQRHGLYLPLTAKLKQVVKVPVIVAGRLDIPREAEKALEDDKADMIAVGRGLLADPQWPNKVMSGNERKIRPCIGCHEGCMGRIFQGKPLSCAVNPSTGREKLYELKLAHDSRNVMVVGGWIAGMEVARISTLRGHRVTLYEKTGELGGHAIESAIPDFKPDDERLLEWYKNQMADLKVKIIFNTGATSAIVGSEKPDVVVVATGSTPMHFDIPGIENARVASLEETYHQTKEIGKRVLVVGGGLNGCEVALWLSKQGKEVTIVEALEDLMISGEPVPHENRIMLIDLLKQHKVQVRTGRFLQQMTTEGAVIVDSKQHKEIVAVDGIVTAIGYKPESSLYDDLASRRPEVYLIGDAEKPSNYMHAIWEATEFALNI